MVNIALKLKQFWNHSEFWREWAQYCHAAHRASLLLVAHNPILQQVAFLERFFCITVTSKGCSHDCSLEQKQIRTWYFCFKASQMSDKKMEREKCWEREQIKQDWLLNGLNILMVMVRVL